MSSLRRFEGDLQQIPPAVSAIKVKGKRLYQLAREGTQMTAEPRPIRIDRIQLTDWKTGDFPEAQILVHCGPGTYIRSIARDCGRALRNPDDLDSCAHGHIVELERRRSGAFSIDSSITLEELETLVAGKRFNLIAPDYPLFHIPAVVLTELEVKRWIRGGSVPIDRTLVCYSEASPPDESLTSGAFTRVYSHSHSGEPRFLGIAVAYNYCADDSDTSSATLVLTPRFVI